MPGVANKMMATALGSRQSSAVAMPGEWSGVSPGKPH
jgi:hypothetical protein